MDRLGARAPGRVEDPVDHEVAVARREPPIWTASSAIATWRAPRSASEKTATVLMPSRRAVLMTRQAISPRLASGSWRTSRPIGEPGWRRGVDPSRSSPACRTRDIALDHPHSSIGSPFSRSRPSTAPRLRRRRPGASTSSRHGDHGMIGASPVVSSGCALMLLDEDARTAAPPRPCRRLDRAFASRRRQSGP
jgi:hypothetical protein